MSMRPETNAVVLVVDDAEENLVLMQGFLGHRGFEVRFALSGEEALSMIEASLPDIVLLDLVLPQMNGFQVCERLKRDFRTRHIPVIIITGISDHEANIKALEAGADDLLVKPFDSVLLEARIRNSLRVKRMQDQLIEYQERLETRIRERTEQVERSQHVTAFSLARLAESRDPETGEHLGRMRAYAREIAVELSTHPKYRHALDSVFIDELYHASPLHDIGKVGIPDRILLKPGKLTPQEFDIMKTHANIGGDTLEAADKEAGRITFLAMGRDIAYFHHERWDGAGYPSGLKEEDIPLSARIVALADVYDALSSKRPYKDAFSHEASRGILLEGRGSQFDPDVVDAFLAREEKILAIKKELPDTGALSMLQKLIASLETCAARQTQ